MLIGHHALKYKDLWQVIASLYLKKQLHDKIKYKKIVIKYSIESKYMSILIRIIEAI